MANTVDGKLWELYMIAESRKHEKEGYLYMWGFYAVQRYINTARASAQWLRLFCDADTEKLSAVMAKHGGTDDGCIKAVNKFLHFTEHSF